MDPILLSFAVVILLFSVIVHEVMHGLAAKYFGDHTAEYAGRLTLNPIPHIDPVGTILLPAILLLLPALLGLRPGFLIGWAKPVPVNPLKFNNIRLGELVVSLAGVGSNFALAIIGTILYHILINISGTSNILLYALQYAVEINLVLGVFNLLPVPPLDGSKALLSRLPYHLAVEYQKLAPYGMLIIFALLYLGVISLILNLVLLPLQYLLGVPPV